MPALSVTDAICQRASVREYSQQPVDEELLREILQFAGRSPSGGNVQPWKVYALAGSIKDQLSQTVLKEAAQNSAGVRPDILAYPVALAEPWCSRRSESGELLYESLDIPPEHRQALFEEDARNLSFFDAPVGLIVTMDRSLCESQIIAIGLFVQNILLLAQERGLATCAQASWSRWSGTIREVLGIAENEMTMLGISLGYGEAEHPVNAVTQPRLAVDDYVSMYGFENALHPPHYFE